MDTKVTNQEKFEAFKAGILKWKNEHREDYNEFARQMGNCNEAYYCHIFRTIMFRAPHIAKEWKQSWGDDADEKFESTFINFKQGNVPEEMERLFAEKEDGKKSGNNLWNRILCFLGKKPKVKLSAPLVLSWLLYGKSFETMVSMANKQMNRSDAERTDRMHCSFVAKQIISVSIKNGYRTKEDWGRYFAMEKAVNNGNVGEWALQDVLSELPTVDSENEPEEIPAITTTSKPTNPGRKKSKDCPLIDYLPSDCGEAIVDRLRKYLISNPSAIRQALPYFVLTKLEAVKGLGAANEYAAAMVKQFPDVEQRKSESSIRQAVGKLDSNDTLMLVKEGKPQLCRFIESDENQQLMMLLENDIKAIVEHTKIKV